MERGCLTKERVTFQGPDILFLSIKGKTQLFSALLAQIELVVKQIMIISTASFREFCINCQKLFASLLQSLN